MCLEINKEAGEREREKGETKKMSSEQRVLLPHRSPLPESRGLFYADNDLQEEQMFFQKEDFNSKILREGPLPPRALWRHSKGGSERERLL